MTPPKKATENDLFGVFYLRVPGAPSRDSYYRTIDAARPLLESREWRENSTGWYLNVNRDNAMRLSFFSDTPHQAIKLVESFVADNGLEQSQKPDGPVVSRVSQVYGGEELRFRRFLSTYAPIGLDIMGTVSMHPAWPVAGPQQSF